MADMNDLYLFGDDFDAILDILEDEEGLDEQFTEAADEVEPESVAVICGVCQKKCKSKSGLKRHQTVKHKNSPTTDSEKQSVEERSLTFEVFTTIVDKAKAKIVANTMYPDSFRDEIKSYNNNGSLQDATPEFNEVQELYKRLVKSGNAEKFYTSFYSTVVMNAARYFDGLPRNTATLLATKVGDFILTESKQKDNDLLSTCTPLTKLSDEEKAGMQYIGGYVFHKLHKKLSSSRTSTSEQAISILKAGKSEDKNVIEDQKLTSCLNRGGLWAITKNADSIFERTEHYFRDSTAKANLQMIDFTYIISKSVHDVDVVSAFNALLSDAELVVPSSVAKDVLHNIIQLYIKVRSFSFAKDVIQKHKMRLKQLKSKALRKEISRASTENYQDRQS